MIRIKDTRYASTSAALTDAIGIAEYYGFRPLEDIEQAPMSVSERQRIAKTQDVENALTIARREERGLLSVARKSLLLNRPVDESIFAWRIVPGTGSTPSISLELHCIGRNSAMAEALLIVIANAIAQNAGVTDRALSINNIGSAESSGRYMRDVGTYLRKHIESISPSLRPKIVEDPLLALVQLIERGHPAVARAPQATEYLTEDERRRFWEFLEYLEVLGLPYELSGHVLGSRDCWAHVMYEISTVDEESQQRIPVAFGGRYDPIMSRFAKKPASAAMIAVSFEIRGGTRPKRRDTESPGIYFAHLGAEARRNSLSVLETLRNSNIPVYQSLLMDRLGEQMIYARSLGVPYILIMGHKEAMEKAVLVREVATNSQDTVSVQELTQYLRRRKIGPLEATV